MVIGYRRKIVVQADVSVAAQIGQVQRGQWIWVSGMNARVLNVVNGLVIVLRYDRRRKISEILQYV